MIDDAFTGASRHVDNDLLVVLKATSKSHHELFTTWRLHTDTSGSILCLHIKIAVCTFVTNACEISEICIRRISFQASNSVVCLA